MCTCSKVTIEFRLANHSCFGLLNDNKRKSVSGENVWENRSPKGSFHVNEERERKCVGVGARGPREEAELERGVRRRRRRRKKNRDGGKSVQGVGR